MTLLRGRYPLLNQPKQYIPGKHISIVWFLLHKIMGNFWNDPLLSARVWTHKILIKWHVGFILNLYECVLYNLRSFLKRHPSPILWDDSKCSSSALEICARAPKPVPFSWFLVRWFCHLTHMVLILRFLAESRGVVVSEPAHWCSEHFSVRQQYRGNGVPCVHLNWIGVSWRLNEVLWCKQPPNRVGWFKIKQMSRLIESCHPTPSRLTQAMNIHLER